MPSDVANARVLPDALAILATSGVAPGDWAALLTLAEVEGMVPLLAETCLDSAMPEAARQALRVRLVAAEARAVSMLSELARVIDAFRSRGIPLVTLKGPVLSQQLYGRPGLRAFSDLDLLVAPHDAGRSEAVLAELGYRPTVPLTQSQQAIHWRFNNQSTFVHDSIQVLIDLHWSLGHVQFPLRLSFKDVWRRHAEVAIDGFAYPALGEVDLVVVTASHAAKHLWYRLEFLAQFDALARKELDWAAIDALAAASRASRAVGLSFLLAQDASGCRLPDLPISIARAEPELAAVRGFVEENRRGAMTDAAGRALFSVLDRRRDVLAATVVSVFVPTHSDWHDFRIPAPFHWVLRPLRLAWRRLLRKRG